MTKEFNPQITTGDIPDSNEFQKVNQTSTPDKTGDSIQKSIDNRASDVAHTVEGIFAKHSEKLFAIVTLIGFTLVFYAGQMKDWFDFWRYSAFLGVVIIFYILLVFGRWIKNKLSKNE